MPAKQWLALKVSSVRLDHRLTAPTGELKTTIILDCDLRDDQGFSVSIDGQTIALNKTDPSFNRKLADPHFSIQLTAGPSSQVGGLTLQKASSGPQLNLSAGLVIELAGHNRLTQQLSRSDTRKEMLLYLEEVAQPLPLASTKTIQILDFILREYVKS